MIFKKETYTDEVYAWHKKHTDEYEISTGAKLFKEYKPDSVVDFGCGIGSYLYAAHQCGIKDLQGYDIGGKHAKKYTEPVLHDRIYFDTDISKSMYPDKKYDIVLCIEVAEHIEPSGSFTLVSNLFHSTTRGKICIFTAAPPGQEGHQHINCKSKEEWDKIFYSFRMKECSYHTGEVIELWKDAPDYILNNLTVYTHI